jgi:hypothetical protein
MDVGHSSHTATLLSDGKIHGRTLPSLLLSPTHFTPSPGDAGAVGHQPEQSDAFQHKAQGSLPMRLKQTKTLIITGTVFLGILLAIGHLFNIFFDGELLAWQVVPPLPDNRVKVSDVCLSGSSARCRAINYITPESPESVIRSWSGKDVAFNTRHDSDNGTYNYEACNYNIFGIIYAVLHTYPHESFGLSCAYVGVHYDQEEELTHIRVYLSWTNCLSIVKIFVPYSHWLYRHCYNG